MAIVQSERFGFVADMHRDSMAPDWLSAQHETGVSNLKLYSNVFASIDVL
jgi:hypothetical protein